MDCSPPGWLLRPWDFPGKNTGVRCHFLPRGGGGLPDPGIEPRSPALQADSLTEPLRVSLCVDLHSLLLRSWVTYVNLKGFTSKPTASGQELSNPSAWPCITHSENMWFHCSPGAAVKVGMWHSSHGVKVQAHPKRTSWSVLPLRFLGVAALRLFGNLREWFRLEPLKGLQNWKLPGKQHLVFRFF